MTKKTGYILRGFVPLFIAALALFALVLLLVVVL